MEEIDRATIKALSADTRLKILKLLSEHRATGADISKRLGLSPSTVNEHMKKLEASDLVLRKETGHKWVYYEPSGKGRALIVGPGASARFVMVLAVGILMFLGGAFFAVLQKLPAPAPRPLAEVARSAATTKIAQESAGVVADMVTQPSLLPAVAMLAGAVIIIVMVSSYYKNKPVT